MKVLNLRGRLTPGIGAVREPPRFLRAGDVLASPAEGVGQMRHDFIDRGDRTAS